MPFLGDRNTQNLPSSTLALPALPQVPWKVMEVQPGMSGYAKVLLIALQICGLGVCQELGGAEV